MPYVDLHSRRREERAREPRGQTSFWRNIQTSPFILITVGFALGVPVSGIFSASESGGYAPFVLIAPPIFLLLIGAGIWQLRQDRPEDTISKLGGEKQLLMALREAGGSITPIEAALGTSLTVDEADEILCRFASKGHLRVESLDGSLYYSLPELRTMDTPG